MASITPVLTIPSDSDTSGAVQVTGSGVRISVRGSGGQQYLTVLRMDASGKWFRLTDDIGNQIQIPAQNAGANTGATDYSTTLVAAGANEYYNLLLENGTSFSGYAEIESVSAPAIGGGAVPASRTLTPAGGVTLDGGTSAVDLSADRTIGLGGTAAMTLSTGALTWAGAAGHAGSLEAGTGAALTLGANGGAVASIDSGGLGLVLAANKNISGAAGTGAVDWHLMSGTLQGPTGLTTLNGDLLMAAAKIVGFGAPQALSGAGAVNVTTLVTLVTSTGSGDALTMADGTQAGQLKFVTMVVDGGSSVLTPTTKTNFSTLTLTAAYDWGLMQWSGSAWRPVAFGGTAAFAP